MKKDVLIIGAGPTGLSLACQLTRFGIDFVIVDKNESVTTFSKAVAVHARTLEIYEQIGLAAPAIKQGTIAGKARFFAGGHQRGEFDLSHVGRGLSPYPYILLLEQSKNEKLLYEYLGQQGHDVLWNTGFESLTQDEIGVSATVKQADGTSLTIEAKYLVACDGAKSPVRHALNLGFDGSTFERVFYVCDVQIDGELQHDVVHICLAPSTFVLFFPLQGENRYRIVGVMPDEYSKDEGEMLYNEIEQRILEETKLDIDLHDVNWFSNYKVHSRHVERFSRGRCFLAGDAAHIHTPVGGQGMNTGLQDGYNLAWKLAAVLQDGASADVLETYNAERLENAKILLQTTDRMFDFVAGTESMLSFLRTHFMPPVVSVALSIEAVQRAAFPRLSQIGINYRHHALADHDGDHPFPIKAGDRMPYFQINDVSIYDSLRAPKFHLLSFVDTANGDSGPATAADSRHTNQVDFHVVPLSPAVIKIFGMDQPFSVLLRPDNYIGFLTMGDGWSRAEAYLEQMAVSGL